MASPPLLCILSGALIVLLCQCSESNFAGSSDKNPKQPSPAMDNPTPEEVETETPPRQEVFSIREKEDRKVDMVWIIDSSKSMIPHAANVRKNFNKFIQEVESQADLRLALINHHEQPNLQVHLDHTKKNRIHVKQKVGSTDGLLITAVTSCKSGTSNAISEEDFLMTGKKPTICGEELELDNHDPRFGSYPTGSVSGIYVEREPNSLHNSGSLKNFYRKGAKTIFVFVTDDNAYYVTEKNFLELFKKAHHSSPSIFGFVGIRETRDCSVTYPGKAYSQLAKATKGAVYDICQDDWTEHFATFSQQVQKIMDTNFQLENPNAKTELTKVEVDGKEISSEHYTINGNELSINSEIIKPGSQKVTVRY